MSMHSKVDISKVKIRLNNINKKVTKNVSFTPSDVTIMMQEFYLSPTMSCLEDINSKYDLYPDDIELLYDRDIFAYDESVRNFRSLEGDLFFCSSATIKIEKKYLFNLAVLPFFFTSMRKFQSSTDESIRYADNLSEARNMTMITNKINSILETVTPHSIILIDGPLVGGNASTYMVRMDDKLRNKDCIPLYLVKNSDSRLIINNDPNLSNEFNSDFHWAVHKLKTCSRSSFFKYTDIHSKEKSKVFSYLKALPGFPERVEMHTDTYTTYKKIIPSLMNLLAYFFMVQGDYTNPQVRPIAIAEKYAREGLRILNIPVLLGKLGFHPTINQVRFG